MSDLCGLSQYCEYGKMLYDRLVWGVNRKRMTAK